MVERYQKTIIENQKHNEAVIRKAKNVTDEWHDDGYCGLKLQKLAVNDVM